MSIRVSVEASRGCGTRVPGGLYLVSGQLSEPCPRLPMELDRCPHCGQGVGPARGWTWITPAVLFPAIAHGSIDHNAVCPLGTNSNDLAGVARDPAFHRTGERAGLIWVGEKFYKTPEAFMAEAASMGVSRRIKAVPRGFALGKDWVYLAHRKAIRAVSDSADGETAVDVYSPGVITLFKPTAIEYVVKGNETDEEIAALEERGISPVKVVNAEVLQRVPALLDELGNDTAGNDELWKEAFAIAKQLGLRLKAPIRIMLKPALEKWLAEALRDETLASALGEPVLS